MRTWTKDELLELSDQYWEACALHAGVKLDVFTALGVSSLTAEEVAAKVGGNGRAMAILLNALSALGLLTKQADRYADTPAARERLSQDSSQYLGYIILHHHHLMTSWSELPTAVRTGTPVRRREAPSQEIREAFLMGMFNLAMEIAPQAAQEIDLAGRRRLLDLGGGPGTYAIQFCLANPELRATVYDLPTSRPFAEKTIRRFGLEERVDFAAGDFTTDTLPGTYDAVWMSHVLHAEGPEACRKLVRKAAAALMPGGLILIHDFLLDESLDAPLFPALFSLNMVLGTAEGRAYSDREIREMLRDAGMTRIERLPFRGPNDSGIVAGVAG